MGALFRSALISVFVHGTLVGAIPSLLLFRLPVDPLYVNIGVFRWLGILPIAFAGVLYVSCARRFPAEGDCAYSLWEDATRVLRTGPYAATRNPMYLALVLAVTGEAIYTGAFLLLIYAAILFTVFHFIVARYEEPRLRRCFGAEYEEYLKRVPRWMPRLR